MNQSDLLLSSGSPQGYGSCRFFNVQPSDFSVNLMLDMSLGVLIMTYSRPLFWATYYIHLPFGMWQQKLESPWELNPRPLGLESSAVTARPGALCYKTYYCHNLRPYDCETWFCVIKHWNDCNYGELAVLRRNDFSPLYELCFGETR